MTHLRVMLHSRARLAWVKDISLSRSEISSVAEEGARPRRPEANNVTAL